MKRTKANSAGSAVATAPAPAVETTTATATIEAPAPADPTVVNDAQIEDLKAQGKALPFLNQILTSHNKASNIRAFTVWLDKDLAQTLLQFNLKNNIVANRPINWGTVNSMARQILNGHFLNTGEPLLFTESGDGIDLQHRCHAVIKAAETKPDAGFETTVVTGIRVDNMDQMIDHLLVMGVAKRTKMNLAHFANVDAKKWEMVEYYLLPEDIRPGGITQALSKLEINIEYKKKRQYYDDTFDAVTKMFADRRQVNIELGDKRIPLYGAVALKMNDINPEKGKEFMEAFFNPLENSLPKGNAVDAMRQELVTAFGTGQRDLTRPIFIRRGMLAAFKEFVEGTVKTRWHSFISVPEKSTAAEKKAAA